MTFKKIGVSLLTLGLLSVQTGIVSADIQTDTISEKWGKPTLVYGGSLDDAQVETINKAFNVSNIENVNRQIATGEDMALYINGNSDTLMYSSVLIQKRDKGTGTLVKIKTPELITSVTENQYANAAITAGVADVEIEVAAPSSVTGESALVGVYKALSANGEKVDSERTNVASQELTTVNQIAAANAENKEFDSAALDLSMAKIKTELAKYKESNKKIADDAEVEKIVNQALAENGLDKIISPNQVQQIVSFANAYQNTSAIDSKEVAAQLESYAKSAYDSLSENYKKFISSEEAEGMKNGIGQFFSNLWKAITNMFS